MVSGEASLRVEREDLRDGAAFAARQDDGGFPGLCGWYGLRPGTRGRAAAGSSQALGEPRGRRLPSSADTSPWLVDNRG